MTSYRDDLAALWKSEAPAIDARAVIAGIDAERDQQRRFASVCYVLAFASLAFTVWVKFQGLFRAPGVATAAIVASIVWQYVKVRRARARCPDVATLGPPDLVRLALRHARTTLKTARTFYAAMPLSLVLGVALGPILAAPDGEATGPE